MTQAPSPETPDMEMPPVETPNNPPESDGVAAAETAAPTPRPATDEGLLRRALEGLLFITDRPLSAAELGKLVGVRDDERIVAVVESLRDELEARLSGYRLIAVAEGWQMATRPELAPFVRKLFAERATMRLSTAAQETLSIIAYKQPLTRAEIEEIRGVEVIAALETLLEKRLVKVVGRKETVGRPLMYGTTSEFLRHFGLRSLEDMPPIDTFTPEADAAAPSAVAGEETLVRATEVPVETIEPDAALETADLAAEEAPVTESPAEPGAEAEGEKSDDEGLWPK